MPRCCVITWLSFHTRTAATERALVSATRAYEVVSEECSYRALRGLCGVTSLKGVTLRMWAKLEKPCTIWKVVLLSSPVLISSAKMTLLGLHSDEAAAHY